MSEFLDKNGLQHYSEGLWDKIGDKFATKNMVGSPLVANTAAAMTDTTKIYVYTGSEAGYVNGDWYYYDGSAWQDGGVYNSAAVVLDKTLSQPDEAAEAKAVGDALKEKAGIEGAYDDMYVGTAGNLASAVSITDTDSYSFRPAGGSGNEIGSQEEDEIIGACVVMNQLHQPHSDNFGTFDGITIEENADHSIRVHGTAEAQVQRQISQSIPLELNHVYMVAGIEGGSASTYDVRFGGSATFTIANNGRDNLCFAKRGIGKCIQAQQATGLTVTVRNGQTVDFTFMPIICDITKLLGSITEADKVYTMESGMAGAGVSFMTSHFRQLNGYIPYNAGSLEAVSVSSHDLVGFNQLDIAQDYYSTSVNLNGQTLTNKVTDTRTGMLGSVGLYKGTNFVANLPMTKSTKDGRQVVQFNVGNYDADVIRFKHNGLTQDIFMFAYTGGIVNGMNYEISYELVSDDPTTIGGLVIKDINLNFAYDGERTGVFAEYKSNTYALDHTKLNGVFTIENGKLVANGDIYPYSGEGKRRYIVYDLGDAIWTYNDTEFDFGYFQASFFNKAANFNFMCGYYPNNRTTRADAGFVDKSMGLRNRTSAITTLAFRDSSKTGADLDSNGKAPWLVGQFVVYEAAEASYTDLTLTPYAKVQTVEDLNWGSEKYTDYEYAQGNRAFEMPVGHSTKYPIDIKAKVEAAPDNPSQAGLYIVSVGDDGETEYVEYLGELPSDPSEEGTYSLKCTVSSGTATISWVAEE